MARGKTRNFLSEDDLEQTLLKQLHHTFGYEILNCHTAKAEDLNDRSGRRDKRDVVLLDRLRQACLALNPDVPPGVIETQVLPLISDRRRLMNPATANRELDSFIRDGVPVDFDDAAGVMQHMRVRLIDFNHPNNNQFLAVSQLWIKTTNPAPKATYRRPDVLLYVNGLPLVFIELKNANVNLRFAYEKNLGDYKHDLPQLFHYNAFCILSNGLETRVGSFSANWEHFFSWLRIDDEKESIDRLAMQQQGISLERAMAGLCVHAKLLDYVENFVLFYKDSSKIIAQNHQFIGVNHAFDRFLRRKALEGKLGVFWHTQGSGKSFSMIFYVRKIFRKLRGNFSFLVVTDRLDLDGQIYRNFLHTGTVLEKDAAQPKNAQEMRKFLGQNKKVVFTLIHKFRYGKGLAYPRLFDPEKENRELIVIVDEAHRTQYENLAQNMRLGLKGAHFIAFTGTPLLAKPSKRQASPGKTEAWFGDYVSEYTFQQAMEDGATVPLFYEKRVPEMLIQNDDLDEEFCELLEDENLEEAQQQKLAKKFAKEMQVIVRDDRLETIARDIVYHFPRRGYLGKAMVVTLDKFTAVKMYDKVQKHWKTEIKRLRGLINRGINEVEKNRYRKIIGYMKSVEMAVVISDPSPDKEKFQQAGLHIEQHIRRLDQLDEHGHDIEFNFKDPRHPLHLVFVCAKWLTGFDVPTLSTLYLDKPMKNHTLMQAIARANRVTPIAIQGHRGQPIEKKNGDIVDYYNVFRNMKKALRDYGQKDDKSEPPVQEKSTLFELLDGAIDQTEQWCQSHDIDLNAIVASGKSFRSVGLFNVYADILLRYDAWRQTFNVYDNTVSSLYEACKPEILSQKPRPLIAVIQYLRGVVDALIEKGNLDNLEQQISELLDESLVVENADGFLVQEHQATYEVIQKGRSWDLSKINFKKLKEEFECAQFKHIQIADLRAFIEDKLRQMMEVNHTRTDFAQKLHDIVARYNSGGSSTENYYEELVKFTEGMKAEDERHVREGLSEDELELYDLLKKAKLTKAENQKVKLAAKHLIIRLLGSHPKVLVQDWWKDGQTQLKVKSVIEAVLDDDLPESYERREFKEKCEKVYDLVVDFAAQGKKWVA